MTATRSPSANASAWSCVTKSAVTRASEERFEVLQQPLAKRAIERAERLVEEEHARLRRSARARRPAARHRRASRPSVFRALEPDEFEQLAHPAIDLMPSGSMHAQTEGDVARYVHVVKQHVLLEDEPDPSAMRWHRREILTVEDTP